MKKRIIALFLLVAVFVPALVACGGNGDVTTTAPKGDSTTDDENSLYDDGGFLKDSIPSDTNFGDETVNLLVWENAPMPEFYIESATGEHVVEDSIYYRNLTVEERLRVKLNFIETLGGSGHINEYIGKVEQAARGGTGDYDILSAYSRVIAGTVLGGYGVNLLEFDVLDFSAPWWSQSLKETTTVNGRLFYGSGDISTNLMYFMNCVFFNTTMMTDLGYESPYDIVQNDEWVVDKMFDMASGLFEDTNANFKKDIEDNFGILLYDMNFDAYMYGAGLRVAENVDGAPTLSDKYLGEDMRDYIVKMIEQFVESNDNYYGDEKVRDAFGENKGLFLVGTPYVVPKHLDNYEDCIYGIVPVPKWDMDQEDYYTCVRFNYSLYTLFAGSPDLDRAATVLECLASEGHRQVTPAVFEITMKYQYALDDVASQMFDVIRETVVYDFARDFSMMLPQTPNSIYQGKIKAGDKDWIAFVGKSERIMRNAMSSVVATLDKLYGNK